MKQREEGNKFDFRKWTIGKPIVQFGGGSDAYARHCLRYYFDTNSLHD